MTRMGIRMRKTFSIFILFLILLLFSYQHIVWHTICARIPTHIVCKYRITFPSSRLRSKDQIKLVREQLGEANEPNPLSRMPTPCTGKVSQRQADTGLEHLCGDLVAREFLSPATQNCIRRALDIC